MSMQGDPKTVVILDDGCTLDVTGGPPPFLVVKGGSAATLARTQPFHVQLDRRKGVRGIEADGRPIPVTRRKIGPVSALKIEFEQLRRWHCLAFTFDDDDPVIIIDPN